MLDDGSLTDNAGFLTKAFFDSGIVLNSLIQCKSEAFGGAAGL